jgi:hypothetical protein
MDLISLPLWSQLGILGLSLSLNVFIVIEFVRGTWTSRKNLEDAQKNTETFQKAWEISESTKDGLVDVTNKLLVGQETMLRILQSLPAPPHHEET